MSRRKLVEATISPRQIQKRLCAIYTRVSTDEQTDREYNSLHAQRDACEAYVASQQADGWMLVRDRYDDGGFSGGTLERPALRRLLADIEEEQVDIVVVAKIDRLSRSLMDFAKLVEVFDRHNVTFVSVTQSFNTTTSMGRLMLHVMLSFAEFEREVIGERIRDYVSQSVLKGDGGDSVIRRVSAAEIETAVIDQVRALLRQPEIVVGTWMAARSQLPDLTEEDAREALERLDPLWEQLFPAEQARIIRLLVERVEIGPAGADICLRIAGLTSLVRDLAAARDDAVAAAA